MPLDVILHRGQPRPNKEFILKGPICKGLPPPTRLPSQLPEPGKLKLQLSLGRKLGYGRVARVYEATVDYANSSPELQQMALPPLVVKVSRRYEAKQLVREAYYYDEMECLQGSVIPRYYGLFRSTIAPDWNLDPWRRDPVRGSRMSNPQEDDEQSSDEEEVPPPPTKLSILVMERLGGRMPLGEELPEDLEYVASHHSIPHLHLPLYMS